MGTLPSPRPVLMDCARLRSETGSPRVARDASVTRDVSPAHDVSRCDVSPHVASPAWRFTWPLALLGTLLVSAMGSQLHAQDFRFELVGGDLPYDRDSGIGVTEIEIVATQVSGNTIPIQGFSMGVSHVGAVDIVALRASAPLQNHGADFLGTDFESDRLTVGCVVSFLGDNPILLDQSLPLMVATVSTQPFAALQLGGFDVDVSFDNTLGSPPVDSVVVAASSETYIPELIDGRVNVRPVEIFRRGDVNGDGFVNGLIDGIALLSWGFGNGSTPGCLAAADVNDDGVILTLNDGIFLLTYEFLGGAPPSAPGPLECGPQPGLFLTIPCEDSPCI